MAKYEEVYEDTKGLFDTIAANADLTRFVNIKLLAHNKSKDIFKVVKANDLVRHMTNEDIIILLNEKIFEKLTAEQKTMVAEEALATLFYDSEADKLVISKPDVTTFSGLLRKYTYARYEILKESIKTLYKAEADAEADSKAVTEKAKKKNF